MRMWAVYLMGSLSAVAAITTTILTVLVQRGLGTVLYAVASAASASFAAYVFVEPFRHWCDAMTGWTSW